MAAGAGCFFVDDIYVLLVMRALLGISVGLIMPLSTGLLAYYFPPEQQAQLMGLSAAMNQMGGVVATLLAGLLATIEWNYAFLVYLMGLIAVVMVWLWLPDEKLGSANKRGIPFEPRQLLKFHPSVIGMLLLMMIFFVFPTNFAIIAHQQTSLSNEAITMMMVGFGAVCLAPCGHAAVAQPVWGRPHCSLQGSHSALFRLPRSGLDNAVIPKSAAKAITMYYWIILSMFKRV